MNDANRTSGGPDLQKLPERLRAFALSKDWHVQRVQGATSLEESIDILKMVREAAHEIERLRAVEAMAKGVLEELDGQEILVSTGIKASFLAEALGMTP